MSGGKALGSALFLRASDGVVLLWEMPRYDQVAETPCFKSPSTAWRN